MKKLVLVLVMAVMLTGAVFADHPEGWGLGVLGRFGWDSQYDSLGGAAFSFKAPPLPIYWGINATFGSHYFGAGLTGDMYFIDDNIADFGGPNLGWYLGGGLFFNFYTWDGGYYYYDKDTY